jgi:hypothetical protein
LWGYQASEDASSPAQMKQARTARHHHIGANSQHPQEIVH